MRIFCCYIVIILIALQSINAIAAINNHQDSHQSTYEHEGMHQDSDHHSEAELLVFQVQALDGETTHSDADHPDCHANHCHHSNFIYFDLNSQIHLSITIDKQVINKIVLFNSLVIRPDFRPPIV